MVAGGDLVGIGRDVAAGVGNIADIGRFEYDFSEGIRFGDTDAHIAAVVAHCAVCAPVGSVIGGAKHATVALCRIGDILFERCGVSGGKEYDVADYNQLRIGHWRGNGCAAFDRLGCGLLYGQCACATAWL